MSDALNLVELHNVTFGYGERVVLRDLSLTVPRGKVTALMGASGGGKTTVLRLIGGQNRAQQGQVLFDGQDVGQMDTAALYTMRRRMGMLFQFGALFTDMDVFDNVAFPLREHTDLPEALIRDIVLMKLHAVGLRGARALQPSEVSGGMARRVALARAIALDPELIMYDEPFAGLDPISLGTAARLIRTLNDALGLTSIVVSHDLEETFRVADQVIILGAGGVAAHRNTSQVASHSKQASRIQKTCPRCGQGRCIECACGCPHSSCQDQQSTGQQRRLGILLMGSSPPAQHGVIDRQRR